MSFKIPSVLSIDIGSVAVSIVQLSYEGALLQKSYQFHHGNVRETLIGMEADFDLSTVEAVVSPLASGWFNEKVIGYDPQVSIIAATKQYHSSARALLFVGAGRFQLIAFNEDGSYNKEKMYTKDPGKFTCGFCPFKKNLHLCGEGIHY